MNSSDKRTLWAQVALFVVGVLMVASAISFEKRTPVAVTLVVIGAGLAVVGVLLPRLHGVLKLGPRGVEIPVAPRSIIPQFQLDQLADHGDEQLRQHTVDTVRIEKRLAQSTASSQYWDRTRSDRILETADRVIYGANNTEALELTVLARREGDPPVTDDVVNEVYDGLGIARDFFQQIYDRNSIDGRGMLIHAVVHFGNQINNAWWNGNRMIFGDGDGTIFKCFTSPEIIGSLFTQGILSYEFRLIYKGQSGALHESICDVFGSLVKQYGLRQTVDEADWLMSAGILGPTISGDALGSLAAPGTAYDNELLGKDPQPAHIHDYVEILGDNGGVHINSGISNHAFYTMACALGGFAWERAGLIWYHALRDPLIGEKTEFRTFAMATLRVAERLYGEPSEETKAVKEGWTKVGIAGLAI